MKKIKFITFVLLAAFLCGCNNNAQTSSKPEVSDETSNYSQIDNPFSAISVPDDIIEESNSNSSDDGESSDINPKFQAFYDSFPFEELVSGAWILYDQIEWLDSETLKIPLYVGGYKPKETTRCGFIVLCDGIVQEYSSDGADDNKDPAIFHTFKYINDTSEAGSEIENTPTYWLTLSPKLDKNVTTHTIDTIKITNAGYFGKHDPFGLNLNLELSGSLGRKIDIADANVEYADFKVYEAPKAMPLTDEQMRNLQIDPNDDAYNYWPRLTTPDHAYDFVVQSAIDKTYLDNGKLKLKFVGGGSTPGKQKLRGSVFVNGKRTKFNGDYDYFEFTVEGGCVNDIDIELENIEVGDSVFATAIFTDYAGLRKEVTYGHCITSISTVVPDANDLLGKNTSQG